MGRTSKIGMARENVRHGLEQIPKPDLRRLAKYMDDGLPLCLNSSIVGPKGEP